MSGRQHISAFTCGRCGTRYENLSPNQWPNAGIRIADTAACSCGASPDPLPGRVRDLEAENERLRVALHDAISRPLSVTPDSAAEFYDQRMADEAEARRPRWFDRAPPAPPGILIAADQSRPPIPPGKTRVAKARRARPTTPTNTDTGEGA